MKDLTAGEYAPRKLFSSDYALTTPVLTQDKWIPAVVEARQADLLAVLHNEWELN
ncbi:hypothetical protein GS457_12255 [Rhodococcus hoagii]|nr:hypothetical protein [Prescottella equi]MBM4528841.1 hypothetical protein [Prescottella equi]MBM4545461.1 hypothetical protein [Prescottella equi]MBM4572230.1 hypothetical protein [Prescottella equi]MBM4607490.1 hypothetical protein [Prescottella equi]